MLWSPVTPFDIKARCSTLLSCALLQLKRYKYTNGVGMLWVVLMLLWVALGSGAWRVFKWATDLQAHQVNLHLWEQGTCMFTYGTVNTINYVTIFLNFVFRLLQWSGYVPSNTSFYSNTSLLPITSYFTTPSGCHHFYSQISWPYPNSIPYWSLHYPLAPLHRKFQLLSVIYHIQALQLHIIQAVQP